MARMGQKPEDGKVTGQPFDTRVSANYRIPGMVFHNGMLVASADARWNDEKDGGGIDLVVSRSKDGENWAYTFVGYLGDNGNVWDPDSSTIMDPVIISDGERLYLLADLFPAGYSINSFSTTYGFSDPEAAFNEHGELLLSGDGRETFGFVLKDWAVCDAEGKPTGYHVKGWYDLYNEAGEYVSNLFFADSPFQPRATSFICVTESADDGKTWSAPRLLDLKDPGTVWLVIGPGKGLVTDEGKLAFTAYDGQNIYLIWGSGSDWRKVKTSAASGESSIIRLSDGRIRAFVRRGGNNTIAYVDFVKTNGGYAPVELVDTGVGNFSNCMVSSLRCDKKWKGREVALVCCPSDSGGGMWAGRFDGQIYAFTLDDENRMTLIGAYRLNKGFFAYSNMAQLPDGRIGVLYEDDCIRYGAGGHEGKASHITWVTVDMETAFGIVFDQN